MAGIQQVRRLGGLLWEPSFSNQGQFSVKLVSMFVDLVEFSVELVSI